MGVSNEGAVQRPFWEGSALLALSVVCLCETMNKAEIKQITEQSVGSCCACTDTDIKLLVAPIRNHPMTENNTGTSNCYLKILLPITPETPCPVHGGRLGDRLQFFCSARR